MATVKNSTINKVSIFVDSNLKHIKLSAPKRKKLNRLLDVNKEVKGFTDEEVEFLLEVVDQIRESILDEANDLEIELCETVEV